VKVFIDSNIPMYGAGRDHPNRGSALRFLAQVQKREVDAFTSTEVLQEILYRYSALGRYDLARDVYNLFVEVCPVVLPVSLADTDRARDLLGDATGISARDAIHAAVMMNHGIRKIATFDQGFDRVAGVDRVDLI
jgi:uncharacterized protein